MSLCITSSLLVVFCNDFTEVFVSCVCYVTWLVLWKSVLATHNNFIDGRLRADVRVTARSLICNRNLIVVVVHLRISTLRSRMDMLLVYLAEIFWVLLDLRAICVWPSLKSYWQRVSRDITSSICIWVVIRSHNIFLRLNLLFVFDYQAHLALIVRKNIKLRPMLLLILLTESAIKSISDCNAFIIRNGDLITFKDDLIYKLSSIILCCKLLRLRYWLITLCMNLSLVLMFIGDSWELVLQIKVKLLKLKSLSRSLVH